MHSMSSHAAGILIGGLVPALLFSVANLSTKGVSQVGMGVGWYVFFAGIGVMLAGSLFLLFIPERSMTSASGVFASGVGLSWGLGIGMIVIAINRFGSPIGILTPIFNMNTLITVLLALWIFSEWKQVKVPQLLLGSVLIVVGGMVVAKS